MGGEREDRENVKHQRKWRRKKKIKSRCQVPLSKYTADKARHSYRQNKVYTNSRFSCQEVKDLSDGAVQMPLWSEVPNTTSSSLPFLIQCLLSHSNSTARNPWLSSLYMSPRAVLQQMVRMGMYLNIGYRKQIKKLSHAGL